MAENKGSLSPASVPAHDSSGSFERYRALARWLDDGGAELDRCCVAATACGHGLQATRAIGDGEVIAGIPVTHVLCGKYVQESDVWRDFQAVGADSAAEAAPSLRNAMLVLMVVDRERDAHFGPYLRSLPHHYDVPTLWEAKQVAELCGTNLEHVVSERREALRRAFDWLAPRLQRRNPGLYRPLTWPAFLWAHAGYTSRAFTQELLPSSHRVRAKVGCLLPFLDLANHRHRTRIAWECAGGGSAGSSRKRPRDPPRIQLRAGANIAAGEEVWNNYAAKSNESWLLDFGFGIPDNAHDYALLKLRRAPCEPWRVRTESLLSAAGAAATAASQGGDSERSSEVPPAPFSSSCAMAQWTCEDSNLASRTPRSQEKSAEALWGTAGNETGDDNEAHFLFASHLSPVQLASLCAALMRPEDCYVAEMLLPLRPLPAGGLRALASMQLALHQPHPRPFALGTDALWRPQLERQALCELHSIATRRVAGITGRHVTAAACEEADNEIIRAAAQGRETAAVSLGIAAYRRGQRAVYRGTALCVSSRLRELQEQATPRPAWRALDPAERVDVEALLESNPPLRAALREIDRPDVAASLALASLAADLCGTVSAPPPLPADSPPYPFSALLSAIRALAQRTTGGVSLAGAALFEALVASPPPLCCSPGGRALMAALDAAGEWEAVDEGIQALHRVTQGIVAREEEGECNTEQPRTHMQWLAAMLGHDHTRRWLYGAALRCAATLEDGRLVVATPLASARSALAAVSPVVASGHAIEACVSKDDGQCRFGGDASTWSQLLLYRSELCPAALTTVTAKATLSRPSSEAGAQLLRRCGVTRTHLLISTRAQHVSPRLVLAASVCALDEGACEAVLADLPADASEERAQRVLMDRLAGADAAHLEQLWTQVSGAVTRAGKKAVRAAEKVAAVQLDGHGEAARAGAAVAKQRIALLEDALAAIGEHLGQYK